MAYLLDTNVLLRLIEPSHPFFARAVKAVEDLIDQGETLCFCAQNVREFWNVCTRPLVNNGLGMSPAQAAQEVDQLGNNFVFISDVPDVHVEWRRLVLAYSVSGVQVHDTNLVALMQVSGISHLLTFNAAHFRRFNGITVVEP